MPNLLPNIQHINICLVYSTMLNRRLRFRVCRYSINLSGLCSVFVSVYLNFQSLFHVSPDVMKYIQIRSLNSLLGMHQILSEFKIFSVNVLSASSTPLCRLVLQLSHSDKTQLSLCGFFYFLEHNKLS